MVRVNSQGCLRLAQAVTATPPSTRECLARIVPHAIRPIIGLQATMVRIRGLPTKVEAASIMEAHRAATAIRKPCGLRRARNAMMETPKEGVAARVEGTIKLGNRIKHASGRDACFSAYEKGELLIHRRCHRLYLDSFCIVDIFHIHDRWDKKSHDAHRQSDDASNPVPTADPDQV